MFDPRWAIVVNPTSGQGKGAVLGKQVAGYFSKHDLNYQLITGISAQSVHSDLLKFISENHDCPGVIAVGGDGLVHLVLQVVVPKKIAFAAIPAGTGNDFVRALKWPLGEINELLDRVTTTTPQVIDLGLVDGEWFGAVLSSGFDSSDNPGLSKLPTEVRNKMGYMKKGGIAKKKMNMGGMAYKEGGKADMAQDKKTVKKAVGMHEKQLHGGKKSDLAALKKGGMAKKMAKGGGIEVRGKTKGKMC